VLAELKQARRAFFAGRAVAEVEAALEAERKQAEAALEHARLSAEAAVAAWNDLNNTLAVLQAQLAKAATLAGAAEAELDLAVARWGGDRRELEALLAWSAERIKAERDALHELRTNLSNARAVLDAQQKGLDEHRAAGCPERSIEELAALDATLKESLDKLKADQGGLQADLRNDEKARETAEQVQVEIQVQADVQKLWQEMSDLIGSASGQTFRTYAQSLTLGALIAFANQQLASLKPRYRLERVPDYEMDLQVVDQDMGDEIRPINSLSGGETFLVSLALALGLSSLSAADATIESLFIDEGFGSLDGESLETALSVLDALQAGGRQVGIISHVDSLSANMPTIEVEKLGGGKSRVIPPEVRGRPALG